MYLLLSKRRLSFKVQIIGPLICSGINLALLPTIVLTLDQTAAFICCMIIILIQGLFDAILMNALMGIISHLPLQYIIINIVGQGSSPILLTILQFILLVSIGATDDPSSINLVVIIFFSIALGFVIFMIFLVLYTYKDPYFQFCLRHSDEFSSTNMETATLLKTDNLENVSYF
jgi:hypothetical protein